MPACDYPLRFQPLFRRYLWGGRRLGELFGKPIGAGDDYAESWEVVDHGEDQSVVAHGPLAGATLGGLVTEHGTQLLGQHAGAARFPLLLKLLDCNRTLSVQVHPNDAQGALLDPPDLGKTEAWVVVAADPGSKIYAGLKPGVTRDDLAAALAAGECDRCLHEFEAQPGDCVFIPAGTVHALGAGLVIAEIQQASDTTFRLFDWNRVGADGQPRPLHIERSLAVTDYDRGPVAPQTPQPLAEPGREELVRCEKFVLQRWTLDGPTTLGGDDRFHILVVLQGEVQIAGDPADAPLAAGQSALLPAAAGDRQLTPTDKAVVLTMCLPD
ncbi:MAG: class I mannose-6-phosphate isomerase [Planctomycetales bacterium]|nr:class I mannose-6-phosphate isomerase [Planctomycetales bacterium]